MHNPINIAFADDHSVIRKGIISILSDFNLFNFILEASDGLELINGLNKCAILPDICIVDLNMNGMNGFDTLREIKKQWPEIKVLIFSVSNFDFYIIRAVAAGASGYLLKNCNPSELKDALLSIYHQGQYFNPDLLPRQLLNAIKNKQIKPPKITDREQEFLKYICSDLKFEAIADKMSISVRSVLGYRDSLFRKFNVHNRTTLALTAIQLGLIPVEIYNND